MFFRIKMKMGTSIYKFSLLQLWYKHHQKQMLIFVFFRRKQGEKDLQEVVTREPKT